MKEKLIITNIQRFSLHDGPGIRTTVFFKGCNLMCPWCSNPENIDFQIQKFKNNNYDGTYGYEIELNELEREILKDKIYYENGGGITFSGGECLLQFEKIKPLLKRLKEQEINICIETSLIAPEKFVDIAIKYVDEFIIDIKILDKEKIYKINSNLELYNKNIKKVFDNKCTVTFRIPLVPEYIVTDRNLKEIYSFLNIYKPLKVEIFKIHRLGENKYHTLGKEMPIFKEIQEKEICNIKRKIENLGITVIYYKI